MRRYDPNPSLSVFVVVVGAIAGLAIAAVLGLGGVGLFVGAVVGVLLAGFLASSVGLVTPRDRDGGTTDDLPPEYHDY